MRSKDMLLRKKELASWWNSVVKDSRFEEVYIILGIDIAQLRPVDKIDGAMECLEMLRTVAESDPGAQPSVNSGLVFEMPKR